jgi:hypothetical protein
MQFHTNVFHKMNRIAALDSFTGIQTGRAQHLQELDSEQACPSRCVQFMYLVLLIFSQHNKYN